MERAGSTLLAREGLDGVLLDAKFAPPTPPIDSVSRSALIRRARASDCRVAGVVAPAGYGKTTLLSEWAALEGRRVGWISLDRFDDDPAVLLTLLTEAFVRLDPERADLAEDLGGARVSLLGRATPRLASAFGSVTEPFVLFLDDLQELQDPACEDIVEIVASKVPAGSQLVIGSRIDQTFLAPMRALGHVVDLGPNDLALDGAGAQQIFARHDVVLSDANARRISERAEGWPVGLHLAALISREHGADDLVLSGEDRYVADYLYRESLTGFPDDIQTFMRRAAVLEEMTGPLCDEVLGWSKSAAVLCELDGANVFLVPLDRHREWYRFHGLFREFLLGELRRVDPAEVEPLNVRAADWYESHGARERALEHLLTTSETVRSAHLATELARPIYNQGQMATVRRWFAMLGDGAIGSYPPLGILASQVDAFSGDTAGAERWAAEVRALNLDTYPPEVAAAFESSRAMLSAAMCADGPEAMLTDAEAALGHEGPESFVRDMALAEAGEALIMLGRVDEARTRFIEASQRARAWDKKAAIVLFESRLADMDMDRGDWGEAARRVASALEIVRCGGLQDYAECLAVFVSAGRLALQSGDVDAATQHAAQAMRARATATYVLPSISVQLRLGLARLYLAMSQVATARQLLREVDELLVQRPSLGQLVDDAAELRARADSADAASSDAAPLTPAELRLLPYLQTHLTFAQIGKRLFVSRHTVASQVHSIYRKFGVSSRDDAVQHATAAGLLGA